MPHADSSLVPEDITDKPAFYAHVHEQLRALLDGAPRFWVSNCAQAAALLYHSYAGSALYGLHASTGAAPVVNWVGFYVRPDPAADLVLGPYHGRPACVAIAPRAGRGVCADAFVHNATVVVPDVDAYPGHIGEAGRGRPGTEETARRG